MEFFDYLDVLKKNHGFGYRELAKRAGISNTYLYELVHLRKRCYKMEVWEKIFDALDMLPEQKAEAYDLMAFDTGECALDIQMQLMKMPKLRSILRKGNNNGMFDYDWYQLISDAIRYRSMIGQQMSDGDYINKNELIYRICNGYLSHDGYVNGEYVDLYANRKIKVGGRTFTKYIKIMTQIINNMPKNAPYVIPD